MQKQSIHLPEIKLLGISLRTNNKTEIDPLAGKIFPCIQRYFHGQLANQILNRKKPGTTFCAYTDYESDYTGDYTYLIGEEVTDFDNVPDGFETLTIPAQNYTKFTNGPGSMPQVVMEPWFAIWSMSPVELGGTRSYLTDFEIYDERAADHEKIVLDICIGLKG
ncbi:MAG: GyrI-like domain-containing protein [Myxococcaceae bacterium]